MNSPDNASVPPTGDSTSQANGNTDNKGRAATILIVEDDRVSQKVLGKICTNAGHKILLADSLSQAREELYRNILVDIIFLDSQVGRDWGWEFLSELRSDPLYRTLPVVIYTAHTEREALLQYIELGVQAVRAKPYRGEVVLAEIDKSIIFNWPGKMMLPMEAVCDKLRITEQDYYNMLNTAAMEFERGAKEIRGLVGSRNSSRMNECLLQMRTRGNTIGLLAVDTIINAVLKALSEGELPRAIRQLQRIELLVTLLQQRSFAFFGVSGAPINTLTQTPPPAEKTARHSTQEELEPLSSSDDLSAAFCRKMASAPAWVMGRHFSRLRDFAIFTESDIDRMASSALKEQPFSGFLELIQRVEKIPSSNLSQAVAFVQGIPDFEAPLGKVIHQLGLKNPTAGLRHDTTRIVEELGIEKALILAETGKAAIIATLESPLHLSHLLEHSLAVGLLAYEIGRILRLANAHLLFSVGAVHDIGRWLLAVSEPGFYSIAVGMAQTGTMTLVVAEKTVFSVSHEDAGRKLLEQAGVRNLFLDVTSQHGGIKDSPQKENLMSVMIIHLANELIHAVAIEDPRQGENIRKKLGMHTSPVWKHLTASGVDLPLSPPELIETFTPIAATANWIASVMTNWAAGLRHGKH